MSLEPRRQPRRCYLVRHGQTEWNRDNRIQGHSDIALDERGVEQARRLGEAFASVPVSALYTSWLLRSRQTAQAIAQAHPLALEPVVRRDIAEIHLGDWEGLTPEQIEAGTPGAFRRWKERPSEVVIPNAEPLAAFKARVRAAFEEIRRQSTAGDCVIVAHGGVIAALLAEFMQADFDHMLRRVRLDNASITAIEFGEDAPHVLWINSILHLADLDATRLPGAAPVVSCD